MGSRLHRLYATYKANVLNLYHRKTMAARNIHIANVTGAQIPAGTPDYVKYQYQYATSSYAD